MKVYCGSSELPRQNKNPTKITNKKKCNKKNDNTQITQKRKTVQNFQTWIYRTGFWSQSFFIVKSRDSKRDKWQSSLILSVKIRTHFFCETVANFCPREWAFFDWLIWLIWFDWLVGLIWLIWLIDWLDWIGFDWMIWFVWLIDLMIWCVWNSKKKKKKNKKQQQHKKANNNNKQTTKQTKNKQSQQQQTNKQTNKQKQTITTTNKQTNNQKTNNNNNKQTNKQTKTNNNNNNKQTNKQTKNKQQQQTNKQTTTDVTSISVSGLNTFDTFQLLEPISEYSLQSLMSLERLTLYISIQLQAIVFLFLFFFCTNRTVLFLWCEFFFCLFLILFFWEMWNIDKILQGIYGKGDTSSFVLDFGLRGRVLFCFVLFGFVFCSFLRLVEKNKLSLTTFVQFSTTKKNKQKKQTNNRPQCWTHWICCWSGRTTKKSNIRTTETAPVRNWLICAGICHKSACHSLFDFGLSETIWFFDLCLFCVLWKLQYFVFFFVFWCFGQMCTFFLFCHNVQNNPQQTNKNKIEIRKVQGSFVRKIAPLLNGFGRYLTTEFATPMMSVLSGYFFWRVWPIINDFLEFFISFHPQCEPYVPPNDHSNGAFVDIELFLHFVFFFLVKIMKIFLKQNKQNKKKAKRCCEICVWLLFYYFVVFWITFRIFSKRQQIDSQKTTHNKKKTKHKNKRKTPKKQTKQKQTYLNLPQVHLSLRFMTLFHSNFPHKLSTVFLIISLKICLVFLVNSSGD